MALGERQKWLSEISGAVNTTKKRRERRKREVVVPEDD